jgi:hypothetical protein
MAHEMCHAYTHVAWTNFQLQLSAHLLTRKMNRLDEAVTSELASLVLYNWAAAQRKGARGFDQPPSGYVGYGTEVHGQGSHSAKGRE